MKQNTNLTSFLFYAPALAIVAVFLIYPVVSGFYYSLTDWNGLTRTVRYTGLDNFREILSDKEVRVSLWNTISFTVGATVLQNLLAITVAILLNVPGRLTKALRTVFFVPVLMSSIVVGYTWSFILHPLFGIVNRVLASVDLQVLAQDWLGDPDIAMISIIVMSVWRWMGYSMVIYLAGLQAVPTELYEAADIDGVAPFRKVFSITLPLIAPAITVNVLISLIGSMKEFDIIYVTTGGGPGYATQTLSVLLYNQAFLTNRMGYGTAIAVVLFALILVLSLVQLRLLRRREVAF